MIKRYTDHSANERTYLAWVRTAIAVMAFGFLVEKFDLFLLSIGAATGHPQKFQPSPLAEIVGLALFALGALMIIGATVRFFATQSTIESDDEVSYSGRRANLLLSGLMIALAIFLIMFVAYRVF